MQAFAMAVQTGCNDGLQQRNSVVAAVAVVVAHQMWGRAPTGFGQVSMPRQPAMKRTPLIALN